MLRPKLHQHPNLVSFLYNDKHWNIHDDYMQDKMRAALTKHYRRYYSFWRDIQSLLAFFTLASMGVACVDYETNYYKFVNVRSYWFVTLITAFMLVCIFVSAYLETFWKPYNDPTSFFKIMMYNAKETDEKILVEKPTL